MDDLLFTLNAILPIIIPIILGFFLKKIGLLTKEFLNVGNKVVFKVLIPVLLFKSLYAADLSEIDIKFVLLAAGMVVVMFFIGMLVAIFLVPDKKQKGVINQVLFRSNFAIIGIPLAESLAGDTAAVEAAVVAAITVPIFNILAVIALTVYDKQEGSKFDFKGLLKKIVTNPLIIGVVCGLVVLAIRQIMYANGVSADIDTDSDFFVIKTIKQIAALATPFALIILGGKFEFSAVGRLWKQIVFSTFTRLLIIPLIALSVFYALGYKEASEFAILIALFATPVAVSSAPMAAEMGQDEELAGQLVIWTSIGSAFSLFIIILICRALGIF